MKVGRQAGNKDMMVDNEKQAKASIAGGIKLPS